MASDLLVPFAMPTQHGGTIATEAGHVVSADFTGDGKVDVVTAGYSSGTLSFLAGMGDGNFLPERGLNVGSAFRSWTLSAADFDTDGKVDLVTTEFSSSTGEVAVYKNDGAGNFTRIVLETGLPLISKSSVGDLNGDGRPDIVYFKNGTTLVFQVGNSSGGLDTESVVSTGFSSAGSLALADVNADGRLDIVASDSTANRIRVFHQNSSGLFDLSSEVAVASGVDLKQVVDLNGDGRVDLLTTDTDSTSVNKAGYYAQALDGMYGSRVNLPIYGQAVNSLKAADFNLDGVTDVAFGNLFYDEIAFSFFNFDVGWLPGQGAGAFGPSVFLKTYGSSTSALIVPDLDGDLDPDIVIGGAKSAVDSETLYAFENQSGEDPMVLIPPAALTRTAGDPIDIQVYFGFPITVTGTPQIALQVGGNTVYANYIGGTGTPTLRFRYIVTATDMDLDGVQLASNLIGLNGGSMKDPLNENAVLELPNVVFDGVIVNGAGPLVQSVNRLGSRSTDTSTVQFEVTFAEPVTGVDVSDFDVAMKEGNLSGAVVQSISGSGSTYQVTVSTGVGSGTLGLSVKGSASIFDLNGDVLGKGFTGGQVYTVRRQAIGDFDNYYTHGHADYRPTLNNGEFSWILNPDAGLVPGSPFASEEVISYLDSTSIVTRPAASTFNFLGVPAGAPIYVSNSSGNLQTSVPYLGFSGESIAPGTFAAYNPADPRIAATPRDYMKVEMVGMRSSSDGEFSLYSVLFSGAVRLWMASSDGLSSTDNIWLRSAAHSHFNTAFSKPGTYEIDIVVSGFLDSNGNGVYNPIVDTYVESGIKTMVFHVDTLGARDDAFSVTGLEALRGSVTRNDEWEPGLGEYTASVETAASKGTVALLPNGAFTYIPSPAFDGTDSFTYRLTNPRGGFTTATVTITGSVRPEFDAILKSGHTDIGVNFEEDAWDLHIHKHAPDTEYEPDQALFYVGRDAIQIRSGNAADPAYDFLGVPAGSSLFVLPEVENSSLLFLGIGGEEFAEGLLEGNVATLQLASVSGPGEFSVWQSGLSATTPNLIMATSDGIDASDAFEVEAGSHHHMNFAFTKQGFYEVTFVASGVDANGNETDSGQVTYYFYVNDGLVPFSMPIYQDPGVGPSGFQSQMADFNGDGKQDLIVAGSGANALGYRQGIGDGNFQSEQLLNAGSGLSAQGIVAVDYDGDGDIDLVAQEYIQSVANTGTITLYRNNGTASFTRVLLASGHPESYRVVAGDLNGDGLTDLVYGKALSTVVYALQQPSGELGAEIALPVTFGSAQGVLLGDMDNDNDLDVVVSNRANGVNAYFSVFSNDGNGVFSAPQNKATGIFPTALQLVDMNSDGRLDVVTGESVVGSRAGYYPQLADGSFGSRVIVLPTNTQLNAIKIADINGDGVPDIVAGAIVGGIFSTVWSPGLGGGAFGSTILMDPNQGNAFSVHVADLDGDNHPEVVTTGTRSDTRPSTVRVYINQTGEDPMVLIPPAARTRVAGDPIEFSVYFGFPIAVTGTPRIALNVGGNTVYANYVNGSGTQTLTFRYTVTATDLDLDGVQLVNNMIELNGGTLTDPMGGSAVLEFPNLSFNGVIANGRGPLVQSITRLDSQSTTAGTVRFNVQFAEAVTGVDLVDFAVRMNAGDLAGAAVTNVTGTGSLYEVTVSTGTGSGTLGLSVNDNANIFDLSGDVLAKGYAGGEVYTMRPTAVGSIDTFYVQGHADYSVEYNNGEFSYYLDPDDGLLPQNKYQSDDVITYLDNTSIVTRPAGANYDFLGVGANQPIYLSNSSGNVSSVPFLGWGGDNLIANDFAERLTGDPRVSGSTLREYVKVQMVGFRSSSGGDFSLYSISSGNPTVWFATNDGIGSTDNIWLYRTHFHRNTAFSKPGTYEVDVVISGFLDGNANNALDASDVFVESGIKTMVFHVDTFGARDDAFEVGGSNNVYGSVTRNDEWDPGLGDYTASVETAASKGNVALQPNGAFTYTPSPAFDGTDSFTYRLTNPRGGFTTATVTLQAAAAASPIAGLVTGHADIGIAFEAGELEPHVHAHLEEEEEEEGGEEHEDHGGLEYAPSEILIQVQTEGAITVPADPQFGFLGSPGQTVYALPTSPDPALPFLGFGTEEILAGTFDEDIRLELVSVSGPGNFSIWNFDTLGNLELLMATADGVSEDDVVPLNEAAHVHRNIAFSAPGNYEVTFRAIAELDGELIESEEVTYLFAVATGRAPELALSAGERLYTEQSAPVQIDAAAMITDTDSTNFDGGFLRVDIPIGAHTEDVLSIRSQGTAINQISILDNDVRIGAVGGPVTIGTWAGGTGGDPLVVNLNSNATVARMQLVLRSIMFANMSDDPTGEHRLVRFVVADGDGEISNATIREVLVTPVNDAPVVTTSSGASSYIENATPSIVDGAITVSDVDSPDFDLGRLVVAISSNIQTQDRLSILAQGDGPGEINLSGNSVLYEGVVIGTYVGGFTTSTALTVNLNASATPDATQALARRIAYHNAGDNPGSLTRTIRFQVTDGDGMLSPLAYKSMEVSSFNDAPAIRLSTTNQTFIEQGIPKAIDTAAVVGDSDSVNFDGGTLTVDLSSGAQSDDVLSILNVGLLNNQISVSGNEVRIGTTTGPVAIGIFSGGSSGTPLVLSLNANATPSRVSTLARNIAFRNPSESPTNILRTARFVVTDGDGGTSLDATRNIAVTPVNDAPMIVTSSGSTSYTENDGATVIDAAVTIADVDSLDFNTGKLTITIGVNVQTQDRLTILAQGNGPGEINLSGTSVLYGGVVIGSYVGGFTSSAALSINLNASATPEATQALARRIAFHNAGDNPTSLVRTIRFQVSDGDGMSSLVPSKLVEVIATNDAPTIANLGGVVAYVQNNPAILIGPAAVVNDVDSNDFAGGSLTVSFAAGGNAADRLAIRNQGAGAGRINTSGSDVTYQVGSVVTVIGTWAGGVGTTPLVIQFNSNATKVAVQALVRNLTFQVIGSTPTSSRTIRLSLTDGDGGTSVDADKVVNVIGL